MLIVRRPVSTADSFVKQSNKLKNPAVNLNKFHLAVSLSHSISFLFCTDTQRQRQRGKGWVDRWGAGNHFAILASRSNRWIHFISRVIVIDGRGKGRVNNKIDHMALV